MILGFTAALASSPQAIVDEATKSVADYNTFPYPGKLAGSGKGRITPSLLACPKAGRQIPPAGPGAGMVWSQSVLAAGQGLFMKLRCLLALAGRPIAVRQAAQTPQSFRLAGPEHPGPGCEYFLKQLDGLRVLGRGVVAIGQAALASEGGGMLRAQQLASSVEIRPEKAQGLLEPPRRPTGMGQPMPGVNAPEVAGSQAPLQIFQIGSQDFQLLPAGVAVGLIHGLITFL